VATLGACRVCGQVGHFGGSIVVHEGRYLAGFYFLLEGGQVVAGKRRGGSEFDLGGKICLETALLNDVVGNGVKVAMASREAVVHSTGLNFWLPVVRSCFARSLKWRSLQTGLVGRVRASLLRNLREGWSSGSAKTEGGEGASQVSCHGQSDLEENWLVVRELPPKEFKGVAADPIPVLR